MRLQLQSFAADDSHLVQRDDGHALGEAALGQQGAARGVRVNDDLGEAGLRVQGLR